MDTVPRELPTVTHPLIDGMGDGFVVYRTSARVLHLNALRSGFLADAGAAGKRVLILTPEETRLTFPMLQAMRLFGCRWAVPAGTGLRLAGTSAVVDGPSSVWGAVHEGEVVRVPVLDSVPWTQITVSARYVDPPRFQVGRVAEIIAAETGTRLSGWGVVEPAVSSWSPSGMSEWVRGRFPTLSRLVIQGHGVSGTIRCWNERSGVFEQTKLAVRGSVSTEGARKLLERLHGIAQIQFAFAVSMHGASDMTFHSGAPEPIEPRAALVGPRAVRDWSFPTAELERDGVVKRIGHPRTPSLLVAFGAGTSSAWADFEATVREFGPETVVSALAGDSR